MSAVVETMQERDSGQAADTGTAVHFAAHMWHGQAGKNTNVALEVMRRSISRFPLADLGSAEQQFRRYAADRRNGDAEIVLSEKELILALAPPEGSDTQVFIQGTLDQVRRIRGVLTLVDIKTGGKYAGKEMLDYHCAQLCAYQVMATDFLGEKVREVCVLRTKDYIAARPGPAFHYASWTYEDALALMDAVRFEVGQVRSGRIRITPSCEQCAYCPAGGFQNCRRNKI